MRIPSAVAHVAAAAAAASLLLCAAGAASGAAEELSFSVNFASGVAVAPTAAAAGAAHAFPGEAPAEDGGENLSVGDNPGALSRLSILDQIIGLFPGGEWLKTLLNSDSSFVTQYVKICAGEWVREKSQLVWQLANLAGFWEAASPWDTVLCELFMGAATGSEVSIPGLAAFGIEACDAAANTTTAENPTYLQCARENVHVGSVVDVGKMLLQMIVGISVDDAEGGKALIAEMTQSFAACRGNNTALNQCAATSFVRGICSGACGTASCMARGYNQSGNLLCRLASYAQCSQLRQASQAACRTIADRLPDADAALEGHSCKASCSLFGASAGRPPVADRRLRSNPRSRGAIRRLTDGMEWSRDFAGSLGGLGSPAAERAGAVAVAQTFQPTAPLARAGQLAGRQGGRAASRLPGCLLGPPNGGSF